MRVCPARRRSSPCRSIASQQNRTRIYWNAIGKRESGVTELQPVVVRRLDGCTVHRPHAPDDAARPDRRERSGTSCPGDRRDEPLEPPAGRVPAFRDTCRESSIRVGGAAVRSSRCRVAIHAGRRFVGSCVYPLLMRQRWWRSGVDEERVPGRPAGTASSGRWRIRPHEPLLPLKDRASRSARRSGSTE
jgi:hypothetical protein